MIIGWLHPHIIVRTPTRRGPPELVRYPITSTPVMNWLRTHVLGYQALSGPLCSTWQPLFQSWWQLQPLHNAVLCTGLSPFSKLRGVKAVKAHSSGRESFWLSSAVRCEFFCHNQTHGTVAGSMGNHTTRHYRLPKTDVQWPFTIGSWRIIKLTGSLFRWCFALLSQ